MKYTLLELVQLIASSMDSDEVNSIGDSVESLQIANCIRTAYFDIVGRAKLPEHFSLITLDAGTTTKPVLMTLPSTISEIVWLKYNKILAVGDPLLMDLVDPLPLSEFLHRMHMLDEDESNVDTFTHTVGTDTFTVLYQNDKQPTYYTTFDDGSVLFDSFDSDIEANLQKSNTLCYGKLVIPFSLSDTFTPDLDEAQFALLLNESKSLAWAELKQADHGIAERNSRRGWTHLQKSKNAIKLESDFDKLSNFGRK